MSETLAKNINTTDVPDDTLEIMLDDIKKTTHSIEKKNQKPKNYFNYRLIIMLLFILILLCIIIIALTTISFINCYAKTNKDRKPTDQYNTGTTNQSVPTMTNADISPMIRFLGDESAVRHVPRKQSIGRSKNVEKNFVVAHED